MIKKYLPFIFITFFLCSPVCSAESKSEKDAVWNTGKDDISHLKAKNSNFKKGYDALKQAKKYADKKKKYKATKRFNDSIKFFTLANEENPNQPDILGYLGYSFKMVGDFTMAEIHFEQGLTIDFQHVKINEYLGELYLETNRINKAKERLKVLKNCKCDEFNELQNLISKY